MGREPRSFSLWATILEASEGRYEVRLVATAVDARGPEERFSETATVGTLEDAIAARLAMVKAVCERLEASGSKISMVEIVPFDEE